MITETCQRWELGRESRRPAGETIRTAEYDVAPLGPLAAEAFVVAHHYSGACSPTAHPFGLGHKGELVGVAVFGPLPSMNAHRAVFPTLGCTEAVTLGRLVLLDSVPGNTVYQALNGRHVGRTNRASLRLLPDGTVLSNKAQGKLVRGERGACTAIAQLEKFGAAPLTDRDDPKAWLALWRAQLTRKLRHAGNLRYLWCLDRRRRGEVLTAPALPYPKIDRMAVAS